MATPLPILVYEPDAGVVLPDLGERFSVHSFRTVSDAISGLTHLHPEMVVARLDEAGLELCRHIVERDPLLPVLLLATDPSSWLLVEGIRAGGRDVVVTEGSWQTQLVERLEHALAWRQLVERDAEAQVQSFMIQTDLYQQRAQSLAGRVTDLELQLRAEKALVAQTQAQLELQRELAMAAVRAKGTFLANMSHELHTPLDAILAHAERLREEHGPVVADACHGILTSGQRLLKVVQDVLDLARLEAGEIHPVFEPVVVRDVVDEVVQKAQPSILLSGAEVQIELESGLPQVVTDPRRLGEALGHLLDNALKFGRGAPARIRSRRADGGIVFSVEDSGIGFEQAELDRMLDAFTQIDDAADRGFGGAGMGLAVANQLARVLGGRLSGMGRPGEGAVFEVWLPELDESTVEAGNPKSITVLVVDDDPVLRKVLQHMLVADGHSVVTTARPEEVFELARQHRPALIALDVLLPGTDGLTLLGQLKADEEFAAIPVVVLSSTQDEGRAASLGACAFLHKPITREHLRSVIAEHALLPHQEVALAAGAASSPELASALRRGGLSVALLERDTDLDVGVAAVLLPMDLPLDRGLDVLGALEGLRRLPVFVVGEPDDDERRFLEQNYTGVLAPDRLAASLREHLGS